MKLNYETQGAITYLVCEPDAEEQVDSLTLGMLTNNHIVGLAPVLYTEMNGQRFFKYNISAKVSASRFFSAGINKQRTMLAFCNILNFLCAAEEYMIDRNCFSLDPEYVFLNVSNCEVALICIPLVSDRNIDLEAANFFKNILFSTQFDPSEDAGYITQMIALLNNSALFSIYTFKELVDKLSSEATASRAPVYNHPVQNAQPMTPAPPVSSFSDTINIDNAPGMQLQNLSQKPMTAAVQPQGMQREIHNEAPMVMPQQIPQPSVPAQQSVIPQRQSESQPQVQQQMPKQPNDFLGRPINSGIPNVGVAFQSSGIQQSAQPVIKPPVANASCFAIPGQQQANSQQNPVQKNQQGAEQKKISFFSLMAHYNKENVALYKAQKESKREENPEVKKEKREKPEKSAKPPKQSKKKSDSQSGSVQQATPVINGHMGVGQQPYSSIPQSQYRTPIQPVPVQNSFNETTVLSAIGGETTLLSSAQSTEPVLVRVKTGERVLINKPVFRIGKEKSYVDYFISDNTAISRSHCNIHSDGGEYFIEDTNSTNHTYLNGGILSSNIKTKLTNGDKVRLANEDFIFSI